MKMNKKNLCIKCNCVISDEYPFISVMGDTYCVPCHSVIHDKEVLREREIEYNKERGIK